jgi:hypothetical protein
VDEYNHFRSVGYTDQDIKGLLGLSWPALYQALYRGKKKGLHVSYHGETGRNTGVSA